MKGCFKRIYFLSVVILKFISASTAFRFSIYRYGYELQQEIIFKFSFFEYCTGN